MSFLKSYLSLALVGLLTLISCNADSQATLQGNPTVVPTTSTAENVAVTFLDAWNAEDYMGMYALLSPQASAIDPNTFATNYSDVENTLKVRPQGKVFNIHRDLTQRQGTTVVIHYDATFDSAVLGKFTDADRTMRLVLSEDKWRVAWSTM